MASAPQRETENRRKAPGQGERGVRTTATHTYNTVESVRERTEQKLPGPTTMTFTPLRFRKHQKTNSVRAVNLKKLKMNNWGRC